MTTWLMLQDDIDRIEAILAMPVTSGSISEAVHAVEPLKMGRGGVAIIQISGPLLNQKSPILDWYGVQYTIYQDIRGQVAEASDRGAKRIDFAVNSPGGILDGLYDTMDSIRGVGMKTRAVAGPTMASAAYMLASQTGEIVAENDLSRIGSIGVALDTVKFGWERSIANTDSPKKRPDLDTEEGQGIVREQLDDIYQVLAEKIAIGRNVSVEVVKRDYGQGAMMIARTAKQRGLIDSIGVATNKPTATPAANQGDTMDAKQLKAEHPDVYDAVFQAGRKAEREQACAHLVLADGSGDYKTAHQAIREGTEVTQLVMANHHSAAMKRDLRKARVDDNPPEIGAGEENRGQADNQATKIAQFEAANPGWKMEVF